MPSRRKVFRLSPDRAAQALSILLNEGKLKIQDVRRALLQREKLIRDLRDRLASLEESRSGKGRAPRRSARKRVGKTQKRAARISKAQHAARQAQGRYLGAIRPLAVEARAKVKEIRAKSGVRASIAAAKRMAKG
jgi:hypothetical protein